MKPSKLLILLATFSMCVTGCNLLNKNSKSSSGSNSSNNYSSKTSSSSGSINPFIPSSSSEPEDLPIPDPGDPLTPPSGVPCFPTTPINAFLEDFEITDYVIPAIADDQAWSHVRYTYFPIIKLWTLESTSGTLYEDQYLSLMEAAEVTVSNKYYETVGYAVLGTNDLPKVVFKSLGDYFVLYICAPEFDAIDTSDGGYPFAQLDEYMDLMNVENVPPFPLLDLDEPGWKYQNHFYTDVKTWRLFTSYPDPNSPDHSTTSGPALEVLYKDLLQEHGWIIDESLYDSKGYFATKEWVEIQFFSWYDTFRVWVCKKA